MLSRAVGFLPLAAVLAYPGSRAQQLSVIDPIVWLAVAVLIGLMAGARTSSAR